MDESVDFRLIRAKELVVNHYNTCVRGAANTIISMDEVFIVWFSKTLQNWKAMVSTTRSDGMYYEVTHDGDRKQTYVDSYEKFANICVPDEEEKIDV